MLGILGFLMLVSVVLIFRTQTSDRQIEFLSGRAFSQLPDGFWKGDTSLPKGSWQGKRFDAEGHKGTNIFLDRGARAERFPFKMYSARALWDPTLTVTRIDYNVPENPFWIRPALDEVVEVGEGKLLGKIHYRILPGTSVALGYFWQHKGE